MTAAINWEVASAQARDVRRSSKTLWRRKRRIRQ